MSETNISCGLNYLYNFNLQTCLTEAWSHGYSFIVTPIIQYRFMRSGWGIDGGFIRPDMMPAPNDWMTAVVGRLSRHLDVDSKPLQAQQRHEVRLIEELNYCCSLKLPAIMLPLHSGESQNLARLLNAFLETSPSCNILAHIPMVCSEIMRNSDTVQEKDAAWNETWLWWSTFHESLEWDPKVYVALELSANTPPDEVISRWCGEPVKAVIVPTSIFHMDEHGRPVLSRRHQRFVVSLVKHGAKVVVSGARKLSVELYSQYLNRMWENQPHEIDNGMFNYAKRWNACIYNPVKPLADLCSLPNDVFENDRIKYGQYEKAIALALKDLKKGPSQGINTNISTAYAQGLGLGYSRQKNNIVIVMVLGAGKGLLVWATLNAAVKTDSRVKVVAVEKNIFNADLLATYARGVWHNRDVIVIAGDMRQTKLLPKADIIVSELQGSWGDSALSPECLDRAIDLLVPGGISIPCKYTSYVAPISSPRLWGATKFASSSTDLNQQRKNLETVWMFYLHNKHYIAEAKRVFTFDHAVKEQRVTNYMGLPSNFNIRSEILSWEVQQDNVMHGFEGYFDCHLYGDEIIDTVPPINYPGEISWFPVFIPLKTPLRVRKGDTLSARFWRCTDQLRMWFEWTVQAGTNGTTLHNSRGRSSSVFIS